MARTQPPYKLFYSHASEDDAHRERLEKHLSLLRDEGFIADWHFRKLKAGDEWQEEIDRHLKEARVILLLVSADFMSSQYCKMEVQEAMKMHAAREAIVIPVILEECDWRSATIGKLLALPDDALPISKWVDRESAWANVAMGIRRALRSSQEGLGKAPVTSKPGNARAGRPSMSMRQGGTHTIEGIRTFWLETVAEHAPDSRYTGFQTLIQYGSLIYEGADLRDEFLWPSTLLPVALRTAMGENLVLHGALSGLLPPLPRSDYVGTLLRIALRCPEPDAREEHSHEVLLLSYTSANTNGACYLHEKGPYAAEPITEVDIPGLGATQVAARIQLVCKPLEG